MKGERFPPRSRTYGRGFEGLVMGDTAISEIDGRTGRLRYRGIDIGTLAARRTFEETVYLVLNGELPGERQLDRWKRELARWRTPPRRALAALAALPREAGVMTAFLAAVASAAVDPPEGPPGDSRRERSRVPRILSRTASIAAASIRHAADEPPVEPREDLGYAAHLLWLATGAIPTPDAARALEVSLIVQAEHGLHAAALAALTSASAGAGLDAAVLSGIAALSGSLHGGANVPAYEMVRDRADEADAREWARARIAERYRFPGYGHRVYRTHDPRHAILAPHAEALLRASGHQRQWAVATAIREEVEQALGSKGIYANIDALTGLVYAPLGLPSSAFTVPFCLAIQTGWMAHALEYLDEGAVIRPRTLAVSI